MDEIATRKHYDKVASQYHLLPEQQFDRILNSLKLSENDKILDAGCGTGRLLLKIADRFHPKETVGMDISEKEIEIAKQYGDKNTTFITGSILKIPYPDEYFDAVISNMVLHHVEDHRAAIQEMRRVLKPKGLMIINSMCGKEALHEYISVFNSAWRQILKSEPPRYLCPLDEKTLGCDAKPETSYASEISKVEVIKMLVDYLNIVNGAWQTAIGPDQASAVNRKIEENIRKIIETRGVFKVTRSAVFAVINK